MYLDIDDDHLLCKFGFGFVSSIQDNFSFFWFVYVSMWPFYF